MFESFVETVQSVKVMHLNFEETDQWQLVMHLSFVEIDQSVMVIVIQFDQWQGKAEKLFAVETVDTTVICGMARILW